MINICAIARTTNHHSLSDKHVYYKHTQTLTSGACGHHNCKRKLALCISLNIYACLLPEDSTHSISHTGPLRRNVSYPCSSFYTDDPPFVWIVKSQRGFACKAYVWCDDTASNKAIYEQNNPETRNVYNFIYVH